MHKPVVWVVGDAMADVEVTSQRFRRTPEDPLAPVLPLPDPTDPALSVTAGGAANVASNLAAMGCSPVLIAPLPPLATDPYCVRIHQILTAAGVTVRFRESPRLTAKIRFVEAGRLIGRVDVDSESPAVYPNRDEPEVLPQVVVLTDYARGTITQDSARAWVRWAHSRGIPVFADPRDGRQDVWNGTPVDVMVSNFAEACGSRAGIKDIDPTDDRWAKALASSCRAAWGGFKAMVVKRGPSGSVLALKESGGSEVHLVPPIAPKSVYAVQGAGDTYLAGLVTAHCQGASLPDACLYASAAAGVSVGKPGTAVVTAAEAVAALKPHVAAPAGVLSRDAAVRLAARLRTFGMEVVLTTGCFRLLSAGHVRFLDQASGLGDYLLVAVDGDVRVNGLKGDVLIPAATRAAVVGAVRGVGAAFCFDEDNGPLTLAIRPAVMVKGGDYTPADVEAGEYLSSWYGRVVIVPVSQGERTSDLIDRIRGSRG